MRLRRCYLPPPGIRSIGTIFEEAIIDVGRTTVFLEFRNHVRRLDGSSDMRFCQGGRYAFQAHDIEELFYLLPGAIDIYSRILEARNGSFSTHDESGRLSLRYSNGYGGIYLREWGAGHVALWIEGWPDVEVHNHFFDFVDDVIADARRSVTAQP